MKRDLKKQTVLGQTNFWYEGISNGNAEESAVCNQEKVWRSVKNVCPEHKIYRRKLEVGALDCLDKNRVLLLLASIFMRWSVYYFCSELKFNCKRRRLSIKRYAKTFKSSTKIRKSV
jgi:hypothetical protein